LKEKRVAFPLKSANRKKDPSSIFERGRIRGTCIIFRKGKGGKRSNLGRTIGSGAIGDPNLKKGKKGNV